MPGQRDVQRVAPPGLLAPQQRHQHAAHPPDGLGVDPASSVVEVRRTCKNTADKVAEMSVNLYPAEKFKFSMRLRRS